MASWFQGFAGVESGRGDVNVILLPELVVKAFLCGLFQTQTAASDG